MHIHKTIRQATADDPFFLRKVFVSHYLNIPYHVIQNSNLYPKTLVEELFAASVYLIRNFELSPYRSDDLEEKIISKLDNGKL